MALFKLMRGSASRLPSDKTDGYIWVTYDENNVLHMYIDYEDDNKVIQRGILSAEFANKLRYTADGTIVEIKPEDLVGKVIKDDGGNKLGEIFNNYEKNQASGLHSHAEGSTTTASAPGAHAEGILTTASGERSHAEGSTTLASGAGAHAEGVNTKATGDRSHAEGSGSEASGAGAHVEGVNTKASGERSHAEGSVSEASGAGAHAEGVNTVADGEASHSEGKGTIAKGEAQHAGGTFNIIDDNNKYLEIVGNGTNNENRSNARTLDRNGNAWYAGEVYVGVDKKRLVTEDELVQSDWNQNDENASNYVKNRTHYEEYSTTPQTVNYNSDWYWNSSDYCIALYGSNMPNFKQNDGTDWILMGEAANIETKEVYNENTGETETYYVPVSANYSVEPVFGYTMESIYDIYFRLHTPNDDEWQYDYSNEHQVTMSCVKNITTLTVHKLDEKYLPENIASKDYVEGKIEDSKADYNQNDSTRASYIKNRPFYDTYIDKVKTYSPGYRDSSNSSKFYISTIDAISGQPPYFDIVKPGRKNYKLNGEVAQVITVPEVTVSVYDDSVSGYKDVVLPSFQGLKSENFETFYWVFNEHEIYIGIKSNLSEFLSTFTIEYQERELKQLDEKFIPDTIARTSIIKDLSNALKGNKSGAAVVCDVSPIEHTLKVNARRKNLFDISKVINEADIQVGTGAKITATNTVLSDFIAIPPNTAFVGNFIRHCAFYDINKNYISDIGSKSATTKRVLTTPSNAYYMRFSYQTGVTDGSNIQIELGTTETPYTPYIADLSTAKVIVNDSQTYPINADGTVNGIESIYPTTTLVVDTAGVVLDVEYNRDINSAFTELTQAIISLGGSI